jgi:regulator of protease activity HflC (stomatin/prohibitin superfamily)
MDDETKYWVRFVIKCLIAIVIFCLCLKAIGPQWNIYMQRLDGQAQLAHAQFSKEVAVAEAKAKMESAVLLANAEVSRAEGVAKANKIIGESLRENESYLRYLWITEVAGNNRGATVVYVPTEANLPILESGRIGLKTAGAIPVIPQK